MGGGKARSQEEEEEVNANRFLMKFSCALFLIGALLSLVYYFFLLYILSSFSFSPSLPRTPFLSLLNFSQNLLADSASSPRLASRLQSRLEIDFEISLEIDFEISGRRGFRRRISRRSTRDLGRMAEASRWTNPSSS